MHIDDTEFYTHNVYKSEKFKTLTLEEINIYEQFESIWGS